MDAEALIEALARLSHVATGDVPPEYLLRELCTIAGDAMDIDGAGVMIAADDEYRFVHATTATLAPLERLQELLRSGPCVDAARSGQPVAVADISAVADRWKQPYGALAHDLDIRSTVAFPLVSRGRTWGVLDMFRHCAGAWTAPELHAGKVLAALAVSYLVTSEDRDAARSTQAQLSHQALHDHLTGLPNRALLFDRLDHALTAARRRQTAVAVLFLDLDRFKPINDTYGHAVGDAVLRQVTARLSSTLRGEDTLARLAGDEFVWIFEDLPGPGDDGLMDKVRTMTSRVQRTFDAPFVVGDLSLVVTASIGVAVATESPSAEALLGDADSAMYAAKERGPGSSEVRDHTAPGSVTSAQQIHRELVGVLDRGELVVHYQPIVSAAHPDTVVAVEALLRWQRPGGSTLPAAMFIDAAIRTGSITGIGRWVILQVCAQLRVWRETLGGRAPAVAYINLSARELADASLPAFLATALAANDLQPACIGLEIVEQDLADEGYARISEYRSLGHSLSIDDFGTGYSSLSRLIDLTVDFAKIDQSFVVGIPDDLRRVGLIDAVIAVSQKLGLEVIAEGVETKEQQQHLIDAGCLLLQGHFCGTPQSAESLTARLSGSAGLPPAA